MLSYNSGNSQAKFNYVTSDMNKSLLNAQKTQQALTGTGSSYISAELKNTSEAYNKMIAIRQQKLKQDEILKNNELLLSKAFYTANKTQKEYIQTLQQQVKAGEPLTAQQKERIKLLKEEDNSKSNKGLS